MLDGSGTYAATLLEVDVRGAAALVEVVVVVVGAATFDVIDVVIATTATLVDVVVFTADDVLAESKIVGKELCSIEVLELVGVSNESCSTLVEDEALELDGVVAVVESVGVTVTVRGASVTVLGLEDFVMATVSYTTAADSEEVAVGPPTSTTWYVAAG